MSESRPGRRGANAVGATPERPTDVEPASSQPELDQIAGSMLQTMSRMLWVLRSGRSVDLPHHSIRLLNRLRSESVTMTQAADEMHLSKPAASAAVSRMEQIGLVRRERNGADGRSTLLRLTHSGEAVAQDLHSGVVDRLVRLLGALDVDDAAALSQGFSALRNVLVEVDPQPGPA